MSRPRNQEADECPSALLTGIIAAHTLRELFRMRHLYPSSIDSQEARNLHDGLIGYLEALVSPDAFKAFRAEVLPPSFDDPMRLPDFDDPNGEAVAGSCFAELVFMHPEAQANLDRPQEGVDAVITRCQETALGPIQTIVNRVLEILLWDCRMPHPADDATYREPRRFLYMLTQYWDLCKQVVVDHMDALASYVPHPLSEMLVNLQSRIETCFDELNDISGAAEARETVLGLIATILSGHPDTFQFAPEYTAGLLNSVEVFLAQTRMDLGSKSYELTYTEHTFIQVVEKEIADHHEALRKASRGVLAVAERQGKQSGREAGMMPPDSDELKQPMGSPSEATLSEPAAGDAVSPLSKGPPAGAKQKGGRPRKRDELWNLVCEMQNNPGVTAKEIARQYNQRFARAIKDGKRERATPEIVVQLRYDRTKRRRSQDQK